ncbi:aldo/keto reductase [Ostreiculturibacter nitratireducens]|uniref:aldo/keto reductase n=1 Tax=Ostreiculturibacter nitratireducens TaxID=3075226 RepID=UPI0031B56CA5
MERVEFGQGLTLSRLVYGMWRLGNDNDRSPARVRAKIDACLAQGITSFDQADIYGDYESEFLLGEALRASPGLRDEIEIVTKCGIMLKSGKYPDRRVKHYDTSARHIQTAVENSLKKMAIEQIDLLLIHRPDPFMDAEETGGVLDDLVAFGKVRTVGVSNFRPHDFTLLQSSMKTPLVTNQIEMSLAAPEPLTNGDLSFLQERRIPPMAWSPLGGGALFAGAQPRLLETLARVAAAQGVEAAAVAVAWLLAHPARLLPVMGTTDLARIGRLAEALKVRLDRETWFELYEAAIGHEVP